MNGKRIIFSGMMIALIGTGLGRVLATLFPTPYRHLEVYQDLDRKYMAIGAVAGFLLGSSLEAVRQLKQDSDRQDSQ